MHRFQVINSQINYIISNELNYYMENNLIENFNNLIKLYNDHLIIKKYKIYKIYKFYLENINCFWEEWAYANYYTFLKDDLLYNFIQWKILNIKQKI